MNGARRALLALVALIVLIPAAAAQTAVPGVKFTVTGFRVAGENPLPEADVQAALARYTGEYSGLDGLLAAADALEALLAERGFTFHRVSLPPQTLDAGVVTLNVVRFRIGKVAVEGNMHFSDEQVRRALPALVPGETPNTAAIARAVEVADRHPSRHHNVSIRQGSEPDLLDAVVQVRDRRPWTLFGLLNNIGTSQTGRSRLSLGAQHANLFGLDHVLTGSWTTSPQNVDDVRQIGASYQVPLYAVSGWLTLSWVDSDVDSGTVAGDIAVSGSGTFWALAFRQDLPRRGAFRHAWSVSLQDRKFVDEVSLLGVPVPGFDNTVRSRPVSVRWEGRYVRQSGDLTGYVSYVHNLTSGSRNDDRSYTLARVGATPEWNAVRLGAAVTQRLAAGWAARGRVNAQYAGETLIPGEQIGIGGATSVRGFEERAVAGDNGLTAQLEIWAPPVRSLYGLQLLGFVDVGIKDLERPQAVNNEEARDGVMSVGLGARWQWEESFSFGLDYARVVNQADGLSSDAGNTRWHLNVLYRY